MIKYVLLIMVCVPCLAQKGDYSFSLFGGQSDYLIDRQINQVKYTYNPIGIGLGYGIGNHITVYNNSELGTLFANKIVLSPSVGSLSSVLISNALGMKVRFFTLKKASFLFDFGSSYQALENTCKCINGDRYRREFSGFWGVQLDYRINKKWSLFINSAASKPFATTLNDPDYYMSSSITDNSKDIMFKNMVGITYRIERKKNKDSDQDGVTDEVDKCPETPKGETVNLEGCSESQLDNDADGIVNILDKCPATPKGDKVNPDGCSEGQLDDDKDGVNNQSDMCKNTLPGQKVNAKGCALNQIDSDFDSVFDDVDKCPEEKGDKLNNGCPIVTKKIEKQIDDIANDVNFVTGKADLLVSSMAKLNELLVILLENPDLKIIISGHTDDVGKPESNYVLSEKRANSVLKYLVEKGISKNRMTALAFGEQQLKESEFSDDARAKNRRVEIKILK